MTGSIYHARVRDILEHASKKWSWRARQNPFPKRKRQTNIVGLFAIFARLNADENIPHILSWLIITSVKPYLDGNLLFLFKDICITCHNIFNSDEGNVEFKFGQELRLKTCEKNCRTRRNIHRLGSVYLCLSTKDQSKRQRTDSKGERSNFIICSVQHIRVDR